MLASNVISIRQAQIKIGEVNPKKKEEVYLTELAKTSKNKNKNELGLWKNDFIEFILEDSTHHGNIENIEKEMIESAKKKHADLDVLIKKTKDCKCWNEELEVLIDQEIVILKKLRYDRLKQDYESKASALSKAISDAEYHHKSLIKVYCRQKNQNYECKKKVTDALYEIKLIEEHYLKFKFMKKSTLALLNNEVRVVRELAAFENFTSEKQLKCFEIKQDAYNDLDFKLFLARNLTLEGEKLLITLKSKAEALKSQLQKLNAELIFKNKTNSEIQRNLVKERIFIDKLSESLKMKNVEEMITHYNQVDNQIVQNRNMVMLENKAIAENREYLNYLKEKKQSLEDLIRSQDELEITKDEYEANEKKEFILLKVLLQKKKETNNDMQNNCLKCEEMIRSVYCYIYSSIYKLCEVKKVMTINSKASSSSQVNENIRRMNRLFSTDLSVKLISVFTSKPKDSELIKIDPSTCK